MIASYSAWHAFDFSVNFSDDWDVDFDHSVTAYSHDMRFGKELVSCRIGPYPYSQNGQIILNKCSTCKVKIRSLQKHGKINKYVHLLVSVRTLNHINISFTCSCQITMNLFFQRSCVQLKLTVRKNELKLDSIDFLFVIIRKNELQPAKGT